MPIAFILALGLATADRDAPEPLVLREAVSVSGNVLRLGDLADLDSLPQPLAGRARAIPVADLTQQTVVLSARAVAVRARAALPALSPWLSDGVDHVIRVERRGDETQAVPTTPSPSSRAAAAPVVRAGEILTIRALVGPVSVERPARALQDGWAGKRVFVRTADGALLSVSLSDASR